MAAKRRRNDILTGGSGDVNPQFAYGIIAMSAANTFSGTNVPFPALTMFAAVGNKVGPNKAPVLELLWADWEYTGERFNAAGEEFEWQITQGNAQTMLFFGDSSLVAKGIIQAASGATDTGSYLLNRVGRFDFTSGDGHGLLVSVPSNNALRMSCTSTALGAAAGFQIRIAYRVKLIPLTEALGMMASIN